MIRFAALISAATFLLGTTEVEAHTRKKSRASRSGQRTSVNVHPETERALLETAIEFNLDHGKFRRVAACESGLNPAKDSTGYYGLFQHDKRAWTGRVIAFNNSHSYKVDFNPHNPFWNARVAAWMIKNSGWGAWPDCGKL